MCEVSLEGLKFGPDGLIPAIVQDYYSKEVLTLAYMNRESLDISIQEGRTCFYSRSRQCLWRKGETSGNTQTFIAQLNATISLRCIEVIALILKNRYFTQYGKTMGKSTGDKELEMVLLRQFHRNMLPVCRTSLADVYRHIKYGTFYTTHQLALRIRHLLKMQPTHHAIR